MNRKMYKRIAFVIFLVATFTLSACGTLRVETEPTVAMVEPAATLTEMPLPTPAQVTEEADATVTSEEAAISPVEFEPMVEPLATVGYSNEENGISFSCPTSWAMEEEAHAFVFRKGTVQLRVGYRMPGDTTDHGGRTGMGGTGVSVLEGTAQFLGQVWGPLR